MNVMKHKHAITYLIHIKHIMIAATFLLLCFLDLLIK